MKMTAKHDGTAIAGRVRKALARGASPVVFNGREFEGFVWVDPQDYAGALPPKRRSR